MGAAQEASGGAEWLLPSRGAKKQRGEDMTWIKALVGLQSWSQLLEKSARDRPLGGASSDLIDANSVLFQSSLKRMFSESSGPSMDLCKCMFTNKPLTTQAL